MAASADTVFTCPQQHVGIHRKGRLLAGSTSSVMRVNQLDFLHELGDGSYATVWAAIQNWDSGAHSPVGA